MLKDFAELVDILWHVASGCAYCIIMGVVLYFLGVALKLIFFGISAMLLASVVSVGIGFMFSYIAKNRG